MLENSGGAPMHQLLVILISAVAVTLIAAVSFTALGWYAFAFLPTVMIVAYSGMQYVKTYGKQEDGSK